MHKIFSSYEDFSWGLIYAFNLRFKPNQFLLDLQSEGTRDSKNIETEKPSSEKRSSLNRGLKFMKMALSFISPRTFTGIIRVRVRKKAERRGMIKK